MELIKKYQEAYEKLKAGRKDEPAWLLRLREEAMEAFLEKGFPSAKDEAWRHTDIAAIRETPFIFHPEPGKGTVPELQGDRLVFINGQYSEAHSELPDGVQVLRFQRAVAILPEFLKTHLGRYADPKQDAFTALNTALMAGGAVIRVGAGKVIEKPIRLVFFTAPGKDACAFFVRNLIVMERGSRAMIHETYLAGNEKKYFMSVVSELVLEEDAVLKHSKLQDEGKNAFHIAATHARQSRGSVFSSLMVSLGSRLMRQDSRMALAGEDVECVLNGVSLSDGEQILDHHTFIDHQQPAGKSRQLFKGLLGGKSRNVFSGKVLVRQDAQKTDAVQTNKSLLLSDDAKVDTQPQLEILADDVKCSHGAAVGQLREDELFYLRSRGIGEPLAGRILAQGFVREVIENAGQEYFQDELMALVDVKLEKQFKGDRLL